MTYNAQLDIPKCFSDEESSPSYFISEPHPLLEKVEQLMLAALHSAPAIQSDRSETIQQAAQYHLLSGGQRLRARLALNAGQALSISDQDSVLIAAVVELIHNASLIHDDLQDGDQFRRGHEAVWSKFNKNIAICCGDLYLSTSYAVLAKVSQTSLLAQMIDIMHQRIVQAIDGQCADLSIAPEQMRLETYIEVVTAKSGALLSLPLEFALLLSGQESSIFLARQACIDFAVGFQIFDDLRDLATDSGQSSGEDHRLNIVSIYQYLNRDLDISFDPIAAAKNVAMTHLQRAELSLSQLPSQSGQLLSECAQNISNLLKAMI